MKIITSSKILQSEFNKLLDNYKKYYWATAWASTSSPFFNNLIRQKNKIEKIVVGLHFYQTHPDFIREFIDFDNVHFIEIPDGTFHPKVYLFYNSNKDWKVILGSSNFTSNAFLKNVEVNVLISSTDIGTETNLLHLKNIIDKSFKEGKSFAENDFVNYFNVWQNQQSKIKSLSGKYGGNGNVSIPLHKVLVANRTWSDYIKKIDREGKKTLNHRLFVVEFANTLFKQNKHFCDIELEHRKFIAGIPNSLNNDGHFLWGVFGSMKGAGIFKNRIIENDINISKALDQIPESGTITKMQYNNFIKNFQKAFIGTQLENAKNIGTATRLLAMKRPDTFICLDNKNKSELCKDFGIKQSEMNFEKYWEDIIQRIFDCNWWINPIARNKKEQRISNARAAFLDSIYYKE